MAEVSQALRLVFARPGYVLLAAASAIATFVLTTWLPNIGLVWEIVTSSTIPLSAKAAVLTALVGSIATNFTNFSASITVLTSLLFGVNVAVVAYLVRTRRVASGYHWRAGGATSLGGLTSGFLGVGCAACGTAGLAPALSFVGAGGLITTLPFGGEEFGMVGIFLLGLSVFLTARQIAGTISCRL